MRWAIWYYLYNLKNPKNNHGGMLILVKLQASGCNITKSNTPPWVFFTFSELYKWYQIAQCTTFMLHTLLDRLVQHLSTGTNLFLVQFQLPIRVQSYSNLELPYRGKKTGHKINRVKLLVGGNLSHLLIKLVTFPRLNFGF